MVVIHNMFLIDAVCQAFLQPTSGRGGQSTVDLWTFLPRGTLCITIKMPGNPKRGEDEDQMMVDSSTPHGYVQASDLWFRGSNRISCSWADRQYLYPIFHIQQLLPIYRRFFLILRLSRLRLSCSTRRLKCQKGWGTSRSLSRKMQGSAYKMER